MYVYLKRMLIWPSSSLRSEELHTAASSDDLCVRKFVTKWFLFTANISLNSVPDRKCEFFWEVPSRDEGQMTKKNLRVVKLAVPCEEYWAEHSLQFQSDVKAEGEIGSDSHFLGNICKTWLEWCSWRGRGSWWRQQKHNRLLEGGTLQDTSGPAGELHFWKEIVIPSNTSTWPTWCHNWYQPCRSVRDWWQGRPKKKITIQDWKQIIAGIRILSWSSTIGKLHTWWW